MNIASEITTSIAKQRAEFLDMKLMQVLSDDEYRLLRGKTRWFNVFKNAKKKRLIESIQIEVFDSGMSQNVINGEATLFQHFDYRIKRK